MLRQRVVNSSSNTQADDNATSAIDSDKSDTQSDDNAIDSDKSESRSALSRFVHSLFEPVAPHSLAALRIFWGFVMLYEMSTYMNFRYSKTRAYLVDPAYMFKYWAFEWVPRLTLPEYEIFFPAMCVLAVCFCIGLFYRVAAVGFFVGFMFLYFQDMGLYLNHFYLIIVLSFAFCFLPVNQFYAVDALIGVAPLRASTPYWTVWFTRFLISNVYVWAGIAKMNEDWIRCEPLAKWVPAARILPPLLWFDMAWVQQTREMACFMSWGGLLLDTFVPFFLAYKPTRFLAFMATMVFHAMNKLVRPRASTAAACSDFAPPDLFLCGCRC
jgi:vitamin K-dependent gamma-carboxylase